MSSEVVFHFKILLNKLGLVKRKSTATVYFVDRAQLFLEGNKHGQLLQDFVVENYVLWNKNRSHFR